MTFDFDRVPFLDGTYLVTLAIQTIDEGTVYDWREQQYSFAVMNPEHGRAWSRSRSRRRSPTARYNASTP